MSETRTEQTEVWSTRVGLILAVAGSAVGLGNFLRFPGKAVQNGGGAFMIPYFLALLLLGFPIGWAEWTMGRYAGRRGFHSAPAILGIVAKRRIARYFGGLGLLIPLIVYMYYALIESWCVRYAWGYATGAIDLGTDRAQMADRAQAVFAQYSGIAENGFRLTDPAAFWWVLVVALNVWLVYRGLSGGIEKFCNLAMPTMAICAVVVLVRVLTLGTPDPAHPERNVIDGLGYMWNPRLDQLGNFNTWLEAAGQVFFSLSVGFGIILNYASYVRRKDDVVLSALAASSTNEVFEVSFGGLITVTAAFVFLGASGVVGGTFGLGFNTLPVVFGHMGAAGRWIGAIWFFMLFLAAITSSLSMLQPVVAFIQEALGVTRGRATTFVAGAAVIGSLWVIYFSKDLVALDTMDFWVGTTCIFVLAGVQIICFSWVLGLDRGMREMHEGALMRVPSFMRFVLKYVAPVYLIVVFAGFCVQNLPGYLEGLGDNPVAAWTLVLVALYALGIAALVRAGEKRWDSRVLEMEEPP